MSTPLRKAMVLAAGSGRRLRPLTARRAKPALPLMGRPLIEYVLARLQRMGIREAVVNLHHHPETVEPSLARVPEGLSLHRSLEPELLGTAGGLKRAAEHLDGEPFLLVNSDTLVEFDLERLYEAHCDAGALATLLLRPKPAGSSYTSVHLDSQSRIDSMSKSYRDGDLMFAGVWVLSPQILTYLSGSQAGLEKELLPRLIEEKAALGSVQETDWISIDTPRHYWASCLTVARERLWESDWLATATNDCAGEPKRGFVAVGDGCQLAPDARCFGAVVLGARCRVGSRAELQNVVCWDDVEIPPDTELHNCVVTSGVRLPPAARFSDRLVMRVEGDRSVLRKREIRDGLVVAPLKSGRAAGL